MKKKNILLLPFFLTGILLKAQEPQPVILPESFVMDVSTGYYLSAGCEKGTRASILSEGLLFNYSKETGNLYTFRTGEVIKSDNDTYMSFDENGVPDMNQAEAYNWKVDSIDVDGTFRLQASERELYILSGGKGRKVTTTTDINKATVFKCVTRDQAIGNLSVASADEPVYATFLIKNPNFSKNHKGWDVWSVENCTNKAIGGNENNFCAESYHSNFDIYQNIQVPDGYYRLTAQCAYRQDGTDNDHLPVLYANSESKVFNIKSGSENTMTAMSNSFSVGSYYLAIPKVQVTGGQLRIGVRNAQNTNLWCCWDNFELQYLGTEEPPTPGEPEKASFSDGDYLIKEVSSGYYLGGGNKYGTQASLTKHAQIMTLKKQDNGYYTVNTHTYNGKDNHFLGSNGYVDSESADVGIYVASSSECCLGFDGGTFFLKNVGESGALVLTEFLSEAARFNIISFADAKSGLAEATSTNPIDATFLIKAPNFNKRHYNCGGNSVDPAWNITANNKNLNAGLDGNTFGESWHSSNGFDIYQELTDIPSGKYKLVAQAATDVKTEGEVPYLYANDMKQAFIETTMPNGAEAMSTSFSNGEYRLDTMDVTVCNDKLKIGVKLGEGNSRWSTFDNFELYYLGSPTLKVGDSGYATYYTNGSWTVNTEESFNVFVVSDVSDESTTEAGEQYMSMTLVNIGKDIPENKGVIIKAKPGTYTLTSNSEVKPPAASKLEGSLTEAEPDYGYNYYTLGVTDSGEPVFKKFAGEKLQANKAYYKVSAGQAE